MNPWSILNGYGGEKPIALRPSAVRVFGATAGILLSQFLYWQQRSKDAGGWFYNTQSELEEQTGLSENEQLTARKKLRALGVLEEQRKGVPARLFYRLELQKILELLEGANLPTDRNRSTDGKFLQNQDSHNVGDWSPTFTGSQIPTTRESSKEIPHRVLNNLPPTPRNELEFESVSDSRQAVQNLQNQNPEFVETKQLESESTQAQVQKPIAPPPRPEFDYSFLEKRQATTYDRDALLVHLIGKNPNLESGVFLRLYDTLISPFRWGQSKANYKKAFVRLEFWLSEHTPKFINAVLDIAKQNANLSSNGFIALLLDDAGAACRQFPELALLRVAAVKTVQCDQQKTIESPGEYITPSGSRIVILEVYDGIALAPNDVAYSLPQTRGWVAA